MEASSDPRLRIENHRLVADPGHPFEIVDRCAEVREKRGAKPVIVTSLLVVHYAVTHSLDATYAAQAARGYYAHFSIDGYHDGARSRFRLLQQVPLDTYASHAGESSWRGREGCNWFSIGVEIANPGPLIRGEDGKLRTVYKKEWPESDAEEHPLRPGWPKAWTHWAKYAPEELSILATLAIALRDAGAIKDIAGHSDISPGRKFDPGPAFPLSWLRQLVFPHHDTEPSPPLEAA